MPEQENKQPIIIHIAKLCDIHLEVKGNIDLGQLQQQMTDILTQAIHAAREIVEDRKKTIQ